ncbi:MAG: glycosyltransferase family 4 protein, partial [Kiritimatiellae bacterium]|nr:glycosyltransferase family 4 protein [Kiritimatiellia bacterium]
LTINHQPSTIPQVRILFVNRMASMERGGGETFDLEIASHLQQLGCEISFLTGIPLFSGPGIADPFANFQFPISNFQLRSPYFGWLPWDKMKGGWRIRLADYWMFEKRAAGWVRPRESRYDVIQVCELPFFVESAKRQGIKTPVVMRLTAPNFYDPYGAVRMADAVITSGETVARVREGERPDCVDIPNAVDGDVFRPHASGFRESTGLAADEYVVLYVARFQDFKNHALLLDAFAQLVNHVARARLVLVGGGPLEARSKAKARDLGIADRTLFMGEVPFSALPDIYAAADVMAVSSDFESFCFAALEAMASGLPIVTTDCGWVPKLVGVDGGVVVPLRDADAFAGALEALARDGARRRQMGEHNRRKAVAEHTWDVSARALKAVYENLRRLADVAGGTQ